MNEYEGVIKDLVKDALMSCDQSRIASMMRWSGYAIACGLSVTENQEDMEVFLRSVLRAIVVESRQMFNWVEKQAKGSPSSFDDAFNKFMDDVMKGTGNG